MLNSRYKKASSRINRRSELKRTFGLIFKIGLPIAFLIGLVWLLRAPFLQIKSFEVVGTENLSAENLRAFAQSQIAGDHFFVIPKTNILFFNKSKLEQVMLSDFTRLEKVAVNKKFFSGQVELDVVERKAEFLWCSQTEDCYFMTSSGLVFSLSAEALAKEEKNINDKLIFRGLLVGDPLLQNFATPTQIQNYLKLVAVFKESNFIVSSINIESDDKAIAKTLINNVISDIIFNPTEPDLTLSAQNVLLLIKETKAKNPPAHFEYIDARFGNKMYYKLY